MSKCVALRSGFSCGVALMTALLGVAACDASDGSHPLATDDTQTNESAPNDSGTTSGNASDPAEESTQPATTSGTEGAGTASDGFESGESNSGSSTLTNGESFGGSGADAAATLDPASPELDGGTASDAVESSVRVDAATSEQGTTSQDVASADAATGETDVAASGKCTTGTLAIGESVELSSIEFNGVAQDIEIVADVAYVATWSGGVVVLDLGDIAAPSIMRTLGVTERATRLTAIEDRAYVTYEDFGDFGVNIYDVSVPDMPTLLGQWTSVYDVGELQIRDDVLYVEEVSGGVRMLDVSDPTLPVEVGFWDGSEFNGDFLVRGDRLYAGTLSSDVTVVDISVLSQPVELSPIRTSDAAWTFRTVDQWLYTGSSSQFNIIELTASGSGTTVGTISEGGSVPHSFAHRLAVHGDLVYMGGSETGLRLVDVSDRTAPRIVDTVPYEDEIEALVMVGEYLYMLDDGYGLRVIQTALSCAN